MVVPEFSEFQFAYGVTREIEDLWPRRIVGVPYFPTQNVEAHIGSDMVVGIQQGDIWLGPLFIQYKRSDYLTRPQAREWDEYHEKYFRFKIRSKEQHNTLAEKCSDLGTAVYAAPSFHTSDEYRRNHQNDKLSKQTVLFDCQDAGSVADGDHCFIYVTNPLRGKFCSESEDITPTGGISTLLTSMRQDEQEFQQYDELQPQFAEIRQMISQDLDLDGEYREQRETENPVTWIRNQQQFFFENFGTVLWFVLADDKRLTPFGNEERLKDSSLQMRDVRSILDEQYFR